jgi:hypothetical protein
MVGVTEQMEPAAAIPAAGERFRGHMVRITDQHFALDPVPSTT